jgi:hypothetical protein
VLIRVHSEWERYGLMARLGVDATGTVVSAPVRAAAEAEATAKKVKYPTEYFYVTLEPD